MLDVGLILSGLLNILYELVWFLLFIFNLSWIVGECICKGGV